ncbi:MAG TPA: hypothetical protein VIY71_05480 [Solirubrobacterales bacterium]
MNRFRAAFQGRKGAVLSVSLIVWALALFDLTLLPRVAGQYLGTLPAKRLADLTVSPASMLMTSTNATTPADLWILSRRGATTQVVGVPLPIVHTRRGARDKTLTASVRTTLPSPVGLPVDVENWPGAGATLFVASSPRRSPSLRLISLSTKRTLLESRVPVPPQKSNRREFFVAHWSGPRPDLFVIDRDVNRRHPQSRRPWKIRVYSGESGFKKLAFETLIKKRLSRQFSQGDFWIEVGNRRQPKASVVLMTKGETGTGQTEVHVLSGHSGFHRFTLESGTELKDRIGLSRRFIFESERRGGTVYMVRNQDGRLSLVPVPLP